MLESYDVEVLHAERGRDGILILEQTPGIDVALIDIMMPEMDGYETMQQIRERPALAELPLIAVTAKAMKGDRQKCLDAGASDYIAKPVDIELLLALLRVWIGKARSRPRRPTAGRSPRRRRSKAMTCPSAADGGRAGRAATPSERARVLVVDDDEHNLLAIRTVLEDLAEVEVAASGEEALRHLLKGEFAVILLDVYMPGMDGYETAQIIREREQTKRIPIVFLSAVNKERASDARLFDGRGRLCVQAGRAGRAALQGRVFVDLFTMTRRSSARPSRSRTARRQSARQCRAARVEQELRSPSSARRRSSSRCRSSSISRADAAAVRNSSAAISRR